MSCIKSEGNPYKSITDTRILLCYSLISRTNTKIQIWRRLLSYEHGSVIHQTERMINHQLICDIVLSCDFSYLNKLTFSYLYVFEQVFFFPIEQIPLLPTCLPTPTTNRQRRCYIPWPWCTSPRLRSMFCVGGDVTGSIWNTKYLKIL